VTLKGIAMCVIMYNMRKASIRQIQHHFSDVLRYIEDGEEVFITKRNKVIAKIVPQSDPESADVQYPEFTERAKKIFQNNKNISLSETIIDQRDERF